MRSEATACLMLHSVGRPDSSWDWSHLTMPWREFAALLRTLRRLGYASLSLDEYREVCRKNSLRKAKVVALTFDDGYLDNWVYAAPILREHGFTGTVFVAADFVDPGESPRPQWSASGEEPPCSGYLNRAELRLLDQGGALAVESHAVTHTWYPSSPRIVDFRHPGDGYVWMTWNANPENKWRLLTPPCPSAAWGEPVYEHQKALAGPRHYPDPTVGENLRAYVAKQGEAFFQKPGWKKELRALAARLRVSGSGGRENGEQESQKAFLARAVKELARSAAILGGILGRPVRHLAWPGGAYTPEVFALAGHFYATTTVASGDRKAHGGVDASDCLRYRRFGLLTAGEGTDFRYLGPVINGLYLEERRAGGMLTRLIRGGFTRLARRGMI